MNRVISIPAILCFISIAVVSNVYGQQRFSANLDKLVSANFKDYTLKQALRLLSDKYKVPLGFEPQINREEEDGRLNLTFSKMPLRSVLDFIVAADSRYVWAEIDGVLNVSPRESSGLLNVSIPNFGVKEGGWSI